MRMSFTDLQMQCHLRMASSFCTLNSISTFWLRPCFLGDASNQWLSTAGILSQARSRQRTHLSDLDSRLPLLNSPYNCATSWMLLPDFQPPLFLGSNLHCSLMAFLVSPPPSPCSLTGISPNMSFACLILVILVIISDSQRTKTNKYS